MGWVIMDPVFSRKYKDISTVRGLLFILCLVPVVVSCAYQGKKEVPGAAAPEETEQRLRAALKQWQGTPYRWGRADRRGMDCSGLVMALYDDVFKMQLPRTTKEQMGLGRPVQRAELRAGDLVFFSLGKKAYHVGVCLNNRDFAHASTSLGVTISGLHEPYWKRAFMTARRVDH